MYILRVRDSLKNLTSASSRVVVPALRNGDSYAFSVQAFNEFGTGPISNWSNAVIPGAKSRSAPRLKNYVLCCAADVPSPPWNLIVTPGDGTLTINFTPGFDGGRNISGFEVESNDGRFVSRAEPPLVIHALTNGVGYSFRARAVNVIGNGSFSDWSAFVAPGAFSFACSLTNSNRCDRRRSAINAAECQRDFVRWLRDYQLGSACLLAASSGGLRCRRSQ